MSKPTVTETFSLFKVKREIKSKVWPRLHVDMIIQVMIKPKILLLTRYMEEFAYIQILYGIFSFALEVPKC